MDAAPAPAVLEYAVESRTAARRWGDGLFLVLGLPALAAVFTPFTYNVSPFSVFVSSARAFAWTRWEPEMAILLLAAPFVIPVAVSVLRLRSVVLGPATRVERRIGYLVASGGAATVATLLVLAVADVKAQDPDGLELLATFGGGAALLAGGIGLLGWLWRRRADRDLCVRVALLVPYVANCSIALVAFRDDRALGWYLTALAAAASLVELTLLAARQFRGSRA